MGFEVRLAVSVPYTAAQLADAAVQQPLRLSLATAAGLPDTAEGAGRVRLAVRGAGAAGRRLLARRVLGESATVDVAIAMATLADSAAAASARASARARASGAGVTGAGAAATGGIGGMAGTGAYT